MLFFLIGFLLEAQHQDKVDFQKGFAIISPIPDTKGIKGTVRYEFQIIQNVDSIFLDAKNMDFSWVKLNGEAKSYRYNGLKIIIKKKFKKGDKHQLDLNYSCVPKQTVYFLGWDTSATLSDQFLEAEQGRSQIWTQGQGKYTSHWLPSFDAMEEKVEFDLNFTLDKDLDVISNGKLKSAITTKDGRKTWRYDMQKPMSSYLLAFAIGTYEKQELTSESGIPIENYYYPQDSLKMEPTYRYTKKIFDFLENEIGVSYPWQNYKQVPVRDFLYAGMENTGTTIFSDQYVIDSTAFIDKNYVNVNAHEMAHQWFGNLVTEKNGDHHWLHEGFATYYAYLAEKEIFGDDHFYWRLFESAEQLQELSERGEGESLLDPKASSLTFYEKGAWALVMLRELVGDKAFKVGIKNYLNKHEFKNVIVSDFLTEMELSSSQDLSEFKRDWLESSIFLYESVKSVLKKQSFSLKLLFEMEDEFQGIKSDDLDYGDYWDRTNSVYFKKHIIENHRGILPEMVIDKAFMSDTIKIRQALATSLYPLSGVEGSTEKLKNQFETLLRDKSYTTIANTLIKLWSNFPEERGVYLNKTKNIIGLPDKNVRLLWLTLAILTSEYRAESTQNYFNELSEYTSGTYNWEIRMTAFSYLNDTLGLNDKTLLSLIQACTHHSWQFKKFARTLLQELLTDSDYRTRIELLSQQLKGEELRYIHTKLDK